ncbi:MAG TPA: SHOCT domain-containing protein [Verrucomicrobiae bacterium]|jgi:hypothetical protein|nr:SHOCT domain-containing protein [Verrucomicrobiae bacterium]
MPWFICALIVSTSVWVYLDATRLGVRPSGAKPRWFSFHADMEPVDWAVSFLLLWFVAFPAYLLLRPKYVRDFRRVCKRSSPPRTEPVEYFYEQIRNLSTLKSKGLITEEEFSLRRREVLGL